MYQFSWMKFLSFSLLNLSLFLCFNSSNWFSMWMSFEINILSFIFLSLEFNNINSNSLIKYFIIQTTSSMIFLMIFLMSDKTLIPKYLTSIIEMMMMFKLGLSPFHFWLTDVGEGLNWFSFIIFSTLQKVMPLFIINMFNNFLILYIILSSFIGMILMFNQTSIRKMLIFSGMIHLSWMLFLIYSNSFNWLNYLILYTLSMSLLLFLSNFNISSYQQLFFLPNNSKFFFSFFFLNLSSIPPFIMFLPKFISIFWALYLNMNMYIIFPLLLCSLFSCFIYIRFCFPLINSLKINLNQFNFINLMWIFFLSLSFFIFIMT